MASSKSRTIDQPVSSDLVDLTKFKELFTDRLSHEETRDFIKKIVKECIDQAGLDGKITNGYSKDRYEEFQEAVKKVIIESLGSDGGRDIIKKHSTESVKDYLEDKGLKNRNFWLPTILSTVSIIVTIILGIIMYFKQ